MVVILITTCLMSCGDDDTIAVNLPPTIESQSFTTSESVDDVTVIGTVQASDPEEEALTFRITEDIDELFEMTEQGAISLEAGKTLDFETKSSHELVVAASDGNEETTATITINVVDENENVAPTIIDQAFEVAENIADTEVIGRVVASDTNGDALTFTLENDADELFEISNEGDLSLIATKTLDFDTKTTHSLIIQVSDGIASASATISISVTNVADLPFVTTWEVTDTDLSIFIPTPIGDGGEDQLAYDYHVDWGDGSSDGNANGDIAHTYATAGTYTVSITGKFPRFRMDEADENGEVDDEDGIERAAPLDGSGPNAPKLKTIEAWG
ncbi:MAG: cadherin domain-containing protein [Bacteroidota bacterium]